LATPTAALNGLTLPLYLLAFMLMGVYGLFILYVVSFIFMLEAAAVVLLSFSFLKLGEISRFKRGTLL
jgi:hypothetical protein